jgi:regulator of protease activity HflC (stomatin/prohibitin superfamily)
MFGILYLKVDPTVFVLLYVNGIVRRQGPGLSFFYYEPITSIVTVPVVSADVPFIFNEVAADFQSITIQGQLTYRIADPKRVAGLLDFSHDPITRQYRSDDPDGLPQRIVNVAQVLTRAELKSRELREALGAADLITGQVLAGLKNSTALSALGVELLDFVILSLKPTPEMAKAMEAAAREETLRQADEAIYTRRNAAVEQERKIKENELNTEIAVEQKKQQIREAQMDAEMAVAEKKRQLQTARMEGEIALEEQKRALVELQATNVRQEADSQAYAVEATLRPLLALDPAVLEILTAGSMEPRQLIAKAFRDVANNASKVGQLNITPDLLQTLIEK